MKSRVFGVMFGLVFLGAGLGVSYWGVGVVSRAKASVSWPTADGKVISSEVERRRSSSSRSGSSVTYGADVHYEYTVDGKRFSAERVSFGEYSSSNSGHARGIVNRYPAGKAVKVHYDPERPEVAVLEPGTTWSAYMPLVIGLIFAIVGAGITVAGALGKVSIGNSAGRAGRTGTRRRSEPPEVAEGP